MTPTMLWQLVSHCTITDIIIFIPITILLHSFSYCGTWGLM